MPDSVAEDLELSLRSVQAAQLIQKRRKHCLQLREVRRSGAIRAASIGGCCLCVCHFVRFFVVLSLRNELRILGENLVKYIICVK